MDTNVTNGDDVKVIVATLTFLVCILTVWGKHNMDTVTQIETRVSDNVKNVLNTNLNPNVLNPNVHNGADAEPLVSKNIYCSI